MGDAGLEPATSSLSSGAHSLLLTTRDAAFLLRTTENTLREWARGGIIPAYRVAGEWRFCREEIAAWIRSRRNGWKK